MTGFLLGSVLGLVAGLPAARWLQVRWAIFGREAADPCTGCPLFPVCGRLVPFPTERS
ncbi:hypothetical protein [Kutzneria sp. NPDC052558]|uniref:hypothetical protein n=1 Tax=Kutzneria sp. NPDC052558 TaxID=3364121 RepID=UPI0037C82AFC